MSYFTKILRYSQGLGGLRSSDILLVSFPKSGNTWVRFFLANLVYLNDNDNRLVTFDRMREAVPELGADNLTSSWNHSSPRFIKTHKPYWPVFWRNKSILLVRDPRDTCLSFYHYELSKKTPRFQGTFSEFMHHKQFGIEAWCKHLVSWQNKCTTLVRYEDLKLDDVNVFHAMLKSLQFNPAFELVRAASEASRFDKLKAIEHQYGRTSKLEDLKHKESFAFMRSGKSGTWRDVFSDSDIDYTRKCVSKYNLSLYEI